MELEHATFLEGLDAKVLSRIRDAATVKDYLGNELIYREGDPAGDFYVLRDGKVIITCTLAEEPATVIRITQVEPGESFGWASLAREESLNTSRLRGHDTPLRAHPEQTPQDAG